jgi:hypothetical protein
MKFAALSLDEPLPEFADLRLNDPSNLPEFANLDLNDTLPPESADLPEVGNQR